MKKNDAVNLIKLYIDLVLYNFHDEEKVQKYENKIFDYITEKLHFKVFPKDITPKDFLLYEKSVNHQWLGLNNVVDKELNYVYDNYYPDTISLFKTFEKEKSPRKKKECIKKINQCINKLGMFNNVGELKFSETSKLLFLSLIKSKLVRFDSNVEYLTLFYGSEMTLEESNFLAHLINQRKAIKDLKFESLFNTTETDYEENCSLSNKGLLY